LLAGAALVAIVSVAAPLAALHHIYDTNSQPLIELAREHRQITQYGDIPPIVRDAILAAEDRRFFSHNGVGASALDDDVIMSPMRQVW